MLKGQLYTTTGDSSVAGEGASSLVNMPGRIRHLCLIHCRKVRRTKGWQLPHASSSVPPLCTVCVTPTPGPVCASVCPQWPPPAACQPAEGRAERLLQRRAIFRSCQVSFGSENIGEGRSGMLEDCLFITPAREHPRPLGTLRAASRGPRCAISPPSFHPETSQFSKSSSSSGRARSSSAAPLPSGHGVGGGGQGTEILEDKHSRDILLLPSLVTLDKSLGFPDLQFLN